MITFQKILAYNLRPNLGSVYEYLVELGLQKIDPPSNCPQQLVIGDSIVLCSSLKRAYLCLNKRMNQEIILLDALSEVVFDIREMCSLEEWQEGGSSVIRRRFRELFIEDRLPESRQKIKADIEKVLELCRRYKENDITIISHSFKLKLIQAYIETRGRLMTHPQLIEDFLFDEKKTFGFGETFSFSFSDIKKHT